jgi:hypothetical protein
MDRTLAAGLSSSTGHCGETWNGVADLGTVRSFPEAEWKEYFSVGKIDRLNREVWAMPQCANDGKWAHVGT